MKPKNDFFTNLSSSLSKKPYLGVELMDFEFPATNYTRKDLIRLKKEYINFIDSCVDELVSLGFKAPKNEQEIRTLLNYMASMIYSEYSLSKDVPSLCDLQHFKKMDCDTFSFLAGDILNRFGFLVKLIDYPEHVLLHLQRKNLDFYLEVSQKEGIYLTNFLNKIVEREGKLFTEFEFGIRNTIVYDNRGVLHLLNGKYREAVKDFIVSLNINPNNPSAYNNRGLAYASLKEYEKSIRDHKKAIQINPQNSSYYFNLGLVYIKMNESEKAIPYLKKAIERSPSDLEYVTILKNIYPKSGKK